MLFALLCTLLLSASGLRTGLPVRQTSTMAQRAAVGDVQMINLFGNDAESKRRRTALSFREAQAGDRKVTFRKPNTATEGLMLGMKFKEDFMTRAVKIEKILPNTEASRLERQGQLKVGDEIVMVSATFGDEMWSARGVGKMRLEKSIAVRQGMTVSFVVESPNDNTKRDAEQLRKKKEKEAERLSRLQKQLTAETEMEKKKGGGLFGGLFG